MRRRARRVHGGEDSATWAVTGGRARRLSERGQSIVELAIILPVLLLIVLTALDLGRVFLGWVVLNNAARVGANYAALHPDAWGSPGDAGERTSYEGLVRDARADAAIALSGCEVEPVPAPAFPMGTEIGDFAQLELACQFTPVTPIIGDLYASTGNQLTVTARSVFPIRSGVLDAVAGSPAPVCPLADFTWDPPVAVAGEPVAFTDASAGSPSAWLWEFGDGTPSSALQNPTHTFSDAGSYTVSLTVDLCFAQSQDREITVTEPLPSPGPGQSAPPTASPPPTPEPCIVPGFAGTRRNVAQSTWTAAGFSTEVQFLPGNGNYRIEYQSVVGLQPAPCNILIEVGPDPVPAP